MPFIDTVDSNLHNMYEPFSDVEGKIDNQANLVHEPQKQLKKGESTYGMALESLIGYLKDNTAIKNHD